MRRVFAGLYQLCAVLFSWHLAPQLQMLFPTLHFKTSSLQFISVSALRTGKQEYDSIILWGKLKYQKGLSLSSRFLPML